MGMQRLAIAAVAFAIGCGVAHAAYPEAPVRIVVPFSPGSGADTLMRLMAQKLSEEMKGTFIVENKPGASGNIGLQAVAASKPDGYTLVMASPSTVVNPILMKNAGFRLSEFEPVSTWARFPLILLAHPGTGFTTLKGMIEGTRASPGKYNYASGGIGFPQFMVMELLKQNEKLDIVHVGYKGSAPAMAALLAGQVQVAADTIVLALPHIQGKKINALAITTMERSALAPDVPSVAELGYPKLETVAYVALLAPAKTPPEILDRLNAAINVIQRDPDTQKKIRDLGADPFPMSRKQFADYLASETTRWSALIKEQGIKSDE